MRAREPASSNFRLQCSYSHFCFCCRQSVAQSARRVNLNDDCTDLSTPIELVCSRSNCHRDFITSQFNSVQFGSSLKCDHFAHPNGRQSRASSIGLLLLLLARRKLQLESSTRSHTIQTYTNTTTPSTVSQALCTLTLSLSSCAHGSRCVDIQIRIAQTHIWASFGQANCIFPLCVDVCVPARLRLSHFNAIALAEAQTSFS